MDESDLKDVTSFVKKIDSMTPESLMGAEPSIPTIVSSMTNAENSFRSVQTPSYIPDPAFAPVVYQQQQQQPVVYQPQQQQQQQQQMQPRPPYVYGPPPGFAQPQPGIMR